MPGGLLGSFGRISKWNLTVRPASRSTRLRSKLAKEISNTLTMRPWRVLLIGNKPSKPVGVTACQPTGAKRVSQATSRSKIYLIYLACACESFVQRMAVKFVENFARICFRAILLLTRFRENFVVNFAVILKPGFVKTFRRKSFVRQKKAPGHRYPIQTEPMPVPSSLPLIEAPDFENVRPDSGKHQRTPLSTPVTFVK